MQISTKGNSSLCFELSGVILYIDYKIDIEIKILVSRILTILEQSNSKRPFLLQLAFVQHKLLLF